MSDPQPVERPAAPALDAKTAIAGFLNDFKQFRADIDARFKDQDQRMTMLDRKAALTARPALSTQAETEIPHQKAFGAYLRSGDDDQLRGLALEEKGVTSVAGEGGFLVDPVTAETVAGTLRGASSIRAIANVVTVEATSFDVLIDREDLGAEWANETTARDTDTTAPVVDRVSIPLHELSALPKASQRLLDDAAFDVEGWLASRIADRFARAESAAFVSGNGTDKPTGFLTGTIAPFATATAKQLGYVATGVAGDFDGTAPTDNILDLVYSLGARYRANAAFVMNSKTAGQVRKMKDVEGRFLWSDAMTAGETSRLLGYPVVIVEDMPDIDANAHAIAFGDFQAGYTIAERPDLRILRDPFSAKPHVLFYATKRVGGAVVDFAAIRVLKFAAS